jgi:hypothetical protein
MSRPGHYYILGQWFKAVSYRYRVLQHSLKQPFIQLATEAMHHPLITLCARVRSDCGCDTSAFKTGKGIEDDRRLSLHKRYIDYHYTITFYTSTILTTHVPSLQSSQPQQKVQDRAISLGLQKQKGSYKWSVLCLPRSAISSLTPARDSNTNSID